MIPFYGHNANENEDHVSVTIQMPTMHIRACRLTLKSLLHPLFDLFVFFFELHFGEYHNNQLY